MIWSLLIATYNRPNALRKLSRVHDSAVTSSGRNRNCGIQAICGKRIGKWLWRRLRRADQQVSIGITSGPRVRGLTSQRNQAIALATSDVLFLI